MHLHRSLLRSLLAVAALLTVVACSDDSPERLPTPPRLDVNDPQPDVTSIREQIAALFAGKDKPSAQDKFTTIVAKKTQGKLLDAQLKVADFVTFLLSKKAARKLTDPNGSSPPTIDQAVANLIASLYGYVGSTDEEIGPGALGNDGKIQVVTVNGSTTTTVLTDTKLAGIRFAGSRVLPGFPSTFTIVIERLPNDFRLDTDLPQFGRYYRVSALPPVQFDETDLTNHPLPVLSMCPFEIGQNDDDAFGVPKTGVPTDEEYDQLVIAKGLATGGIQTLPDAGASFVFCNAGTVPDNGYGALDRDGGMWSHLARLASRAASVFTPTPLYAGHAGKSGTLKSLSPFGFVIEDPVSSVFISPVADVDNVLPPSEPTLALEARAFGPGENEIVGRPVTWASSQPSVATVSAAGLVTRQGFGSTVITATIGGVTAAYTVLVSDAAGLTVQVQPDPLFLFEADVGSISVVATAVAAAGPPVSCTGFTSSAPSVASVGPYVSGSAAVSGIVARRDPVILNGSCTVGSTAAPVSSAVYVSPYSF